MAHNALPPATFWMENNRSLPDGTSFDINYAYKTVLGQSANIIIGSITAFLVSQLVDAYTFQYIKKSNTAPVPVAQGYRVDGDLAGDRQFSDNICSLLSSGELVSFRGNTGGIYSIRLQGRACHSPHAGYL